MPGFDKTGPECKGSRTGRGLGKCTTKQTDPENSNGQDNHDLRGNRGKRFRQVKKGGGMGNRNRFRGGAE